MFGSTLSKICMSRPWDQPHSQAIGWSRNGTRHVLYYYPPVFDGLQPTGVRMAWEQGYVLCLRNLSIKLQWRTLSVLISCRVQFVYEFEAYPKSAPIPGSYAACMFVSVLNVALTSKRCWYPDLQSNCCCLWY